MMKRQNKKRGFTIVELTIVVSVIAILSAVLIPTFSGIIKKSRLSADKVAVRDMNIALATAAAGEDLNLEGAMKALDEAGYNALETLVPVSKDHRFHWDETTDTIVLVDRSTNTIVFPENHETAFDANWADLRKDGIQHANIVTEDVKDFSTALEEGAKQVTLTKTLEIKGTTVLKDNANTVIKLNGNKLDASKSSSRPFELSGENTSLTFDATGSEIEAGKYGLVNVPAGTNADVNLTGGTFTANEDSDNGAFIKVRPGASADVVLTNVTYIDTTGENFLMNSQGAAGATLKINGGTYQAKHGFAADTAEIVGATIITDGYAIYVDGDTTIKDCTITAGDTPDDAGLAHGAIVAANGAKVTVDNCNITTNGNIVAYFACNSGAEITVTNPQGAATYGSTLPSINAGATIKITIAGEVVVNESKPAADAE